jgi:transposase-like protein
MESPKTLQQAIIHYADPDNCIAFLSLQRWPKGDVKCPTCGSDRVAYVPTRRVWQCKTRHPKSQFSIKVGTIFEDSAIGLDKWLVAFWLLANSKNGVSSHELARSVGITQKSAWHMLHRIRLAMQDTDAGMNLGGKKGGPVEVDEAFVGGDPKNWHNSYREKMRRESRSERIQKYKNAYTHKTAVIGMFDRESRQIRAKVVPNVRRDTLQKEILSTIKPNCHVYTDEAVVYTSLREDYVHKTVNHAVRYVDGQVHTNSLENFWSLMKRNLSGTYVCVEPFHLDRYLDEQVFRFNNRQNKTDFDASSWRSHAS